MHELVFRQKKAVYNGSLSLPLSLFGLYNYIGWADAAPLLLEKRVWDKTKRGGDVEAASLSRGKCEMPAEPGCMNNDLNYTYSSAGGCRIAWHYWGGINNIFVHDTRRACQHQETNKKFQEF